jgi:fatty acid desaturase
MLLTHEERSRRNDAVKAASGNDGMPQLQSSAKTVLTQQQASTAPPRSGSVTVERPSTFRDLVIGLSWLAGLVVLGYLATILIHPVAGLAIVALAAPRLWRHLPEGLKNALHG